MTEYICKNCGHTLIESRDVNFQLQDVIPYLHWKKMNEKGKLDFFVSMGPPTAEEIEKFNPKLVMTVDCMEKGCKCKYGEPK